MAEAQKAEQSAEPGGKERTSSHYLTLTLTPCFTLQTSKAGQLEKELQIEHDVRKCQNCHQKCQRHQTSANFPRRFKPNNKIEARVYPQQQPPLAFKTMTKTNKKPNNQLAFGRAFIFPTKRFEWKEDPKNKLKITDNNRGLQMPCHLHTLLRAPRALHSLAQGVQS